MKLMRKPALVILGASLLMLFAGCIRESLEYGDKGENTIDTGGDFSEGRLVTFRFDASQSTPDTKSLTPGADGEETAITTVDVLLFRGVEGSGQTGNDTFRGRVAASSNGDGTWSAVLPKHEQKALLVFIVNASDRVDAMMTGGVVRPDQSRKLEVMRNLTFDTSSPWDTETPRYLPMWTEKRIVISDNMAPLGPLKLFRAVARVDVGLKFKSPYSDDLDAAGADIAEGLSNFTLTKAIVCNIPQTSRLVPTDGNVSWGNADDVAGIKNPSLADASQVSRLEHLAEPESGGKYFFRQIYVGEQTNGNKQLVNRPCVIVGGRYEGGAETYYRLDFSKPAAADGTVSYYDLIRNNRYRLNITAVTGNGYNNVDDALKNESVNITYDVMPWGSKDVDGGISGPYDLTVSASSLEFFRTTSTTSLSVTSDRDWRPVAAPAEEGTFDWIVLPSPTGGDYYKGGDQPVDIGISVKIWPKASGGNGGYVDVSDTREGWFYIESGNLTKKIKVVQSADVLMNIDVTPTSLIFRKTASTAGEKTITVTVQPNLSDTNNEAAKTIEFGYSTTAAPVGNNGPIVWADGGYMKSTGEKGDAATNTVVKTFSFLPKDRANSVSGILAGTITIYLRDKESGRVTTRTVTVQQLATDIALGIVRIEDVAPAGSDSFSFNVTSEVDWWITDVKLKQNDGTGIATQEASLVDGKSESDPYLSGNAQVTISVKPNNSWLPRAFLFYPASKDPEFSTEPFEVRQQAPAPLLEPDWTEHDFGSGRDAERVKLKLKTNAPVKSNPVSNNDEWNRVNNSSSPVRTTLQAGLGSATFTTTYIVREEVSGDGQYITFIPRNYESRESGSPAAEIPDAAGTKHETVITFTTNVPQGNLPEGVKNATSDITIRRTTPAFLDAASVAPASGTVMPAAGGKATVSVKTNAAWVASIGNSTGTGVKDAKPYQQQTAELDVPAAGYTNTPGATTNHEVRLRYGAPGITATSGGEETVLTLSQYLYYITTPNSLTWKDSKDGFDNSFFAGSTQGDGTGGEVIMNFVSQVNVPSVDVRFVDGNWAGIGAQTSSVAVNNGVSDALSFPAYDGYGSRSVRLQWNNPLTGTWEDAGSPVTQYGYTNPRLSFTSSNEVQIKALPDGGNYNLNLKVEKAAEQVSGKDVVPYLGSKGAVNVTARATYAPESSKIAHPRGVVQQLPNTATLKQGSLNYSDAQSAGSVQYSIGKSLFPRFITFSAANNRHSVDPVHSNEDINVTVQNGGKYGIYQDGLGEVLTVNGKAIVASPKAIEVSTVGWQSTTGTSLELIYRYENQKGNPLQGHSSSGEILGQFSDGRWTNICSSYAASNSGEAMVQGLKWRFPTDEEMIAIINREMANYSNHVESGNLASSPGEGFVCNALVDDFFMTTGFHLDWTSGNMSLYPHFVTHDNDDSAHAVSGSNYYDSQYKVTITVSRDPGSSVDIYEYVDEIKLPQNKRIFVRCVADLVN